MELDEYIEAHSQPEPEYLARVNRATHVRLINPRMIAGHMQGALS